MTSQSGIRAENTVAVAAEPPWPPGRIPASVQATGFLITPTAHELRRGQSVVLLLLAAVWTSLYIAAIAIGGQTGSDLSRYLGLIAAAVLLTRVARRSSASATHKMVAAWMLMVLAALYLSITVAALWYLAFVFPVFLSMVWLGLARPDLAIGLVFVSAGFHGTITAYTPIKVGVVVDALLVGLYVAILVRYARGAERRRVSFPPAVLIMGAFLLISIFQLIISEPSGAFVSFRYSTWYMLAVIMIAYANWNDLLVRRMAHTLVVVGLFVGAYAIFRKVVGQGASETAQSLASIGTYNTIGTEQKLLGSFVTGAGLAQWTALTTPMLAAMVFAFTGRWRTIAAVAAVFSLVAATAADSRTGLAAVGLGLAVVPAGALFSRAFPAFRAATAFALAAVILGIGTIGYLSVTANSPERRAHYAGLLNRDEDYSYAARRLKWSNALPEIREHPAGHGFGSAGRVGQNNGYYDIDTTNVDNSYLFMALQQGFLVMGLFIVALMAMIINLLYLAIRSTDRFASALSLGAASSLVAFGVMMYTGPYVEGLVALWGWLLVGLAFSQLVVVRAVKAARTPRRPDQPDRTDPEGRPAVAALT